MTEAFQDHLMKLYDGGCAVFGLALGNELGLFKAMAKMGRPCSSDELARTTGCKERYVREWLSAMACAGIITYDADTKQFDIPRERLPCLTDFSTIPVGIMAVLGQKHNLLKDCFRLDGPAGIDQNGLPDSIKWLTEFRKEVFGQVLDDMILADVPGLTERLESGITVLDLGCGCGLMARMIAERFPNSTVIGSDIDEKQLEEGNEMAKQKKMTNLRYEWADIHKHPEEWAGKFDFIFAIDVIHDLPFPGVAVMETYKILKDGGVFSMIEPNFHTDLKDNIKNHPGADPYILSLYWCLPHSLSVPSGEGWGRTLGKEKHAELLKLGGFKDFKLIDGDMNHFICPK